MMARSGKSGLVREVSFVKILMEHFDLNVRLVSVYQLIQVITDLAKGFTLVCEY